MDASQFSTKSYSQRHVLSKQFASAGLDFVELVNPAKPISAPLQKFNLY